MPVTPRPPLVVDPSEFIPNLLKPRRMQPVNSLQLRRNLASAFKPGADLQPQLLVRFEPELRGTFYTAWANANVNRAVSALTSISVFRASAPVFGASASKLPAYYTANNSANRPPLFLRGQLKPPAEWPDWSLEGESNDSLFLDQAHEDVMAGSYAMIQRPSSPFSTDLVRTVKRVVDAQTLQRTAYGMSGKTTRLGFSTQWWMSDGCTCYAGPLSTRRANGWSLPRSRLMTTCRDRKIPLGRLYSEITSGRWVIFSGERTDIPGVTGVKNSELLMISGLQQSFDPKLPGDSIHTTLLLATPTAYSYKRSTLTIYGNVVKASHGETRRETLGSGDGSVALQAFALKQPPLTFVPAPNPSGVTTTLDVYVNDVRWRATDALAGAARKDRVYITKTDDAAVTTIVFGTGDEGARLPTGSRMSERSIAMELVTGQCESRADQPAGIEAAWCEGSRKSARASGGADRESRDQARANAPLAVMSLDRLVSVTDYGDFSRTFAGIGKAAARRLSDGRRELVHVTIAGIDEIPIDPISDLYRNLVIALQKYGDVALPVQVDSRELVVLVLSARIRIEPDRLWDVVVDRVAPRCSKHSGSRNNLSANRRFYARRLRSFKTWRA